MWGTSGIPVMFYRVFQKSLIWLEVNEKVKYFIYPFYVFCKLMKKWITSDIQLMFL